MKTDQKLKFLIGMYLGVLVFLLLSVIATPLVIQYGVSVTQEFIIEEDVIETALIIILIGISYVILRGFKKALNAYERITKRTGEENSKLESRLIEAFSYIGTVNVELQEVQSILCGAERYPQTKKELKRFIDHLVAKAMTVAGTSWAVIRIISRCTGHTVKEYATVRPGKVLPSVTMGNREILDDRHIEGLKKVGSRQTNLNLLTVCILPKRQLSEEENILITTITSQIEMFFLLYRSGFLHQQFLMDQNEENCPSNHLLSEKVSNR